MWPPLGTWSAPHVNSSSAGARRLAAAPASGTPSSSSSSSLLLASPAPLRADAVEEATDERRRSFFSSFSRLSMAVAGAEQMWRHCRVCILTPADEMERMPGGVTTCHVMAVGSN